jgi:hypothetical protein
MVNNEIFLPLINFILLDYSTDLYIKILDYIPNIKYLPDKVFIENTFRIAVKILNIEVNLTG